LLAWVLGLLFSLDITILRDTLPLLLACIGYGAVIVLSAGTLALGLSSLSRNSRYIALFWGALVVVSSILGTIPTQVDAEQRRLKHFHRQAEIANRQARPGGAQTPEQARAWQEAVRKAQDEYFAEELRASRSNWRPMVSYTGNLSRIGRQLI